MHCYSATIEDSVQYSRRADGIPCFFHAENPSLFLGSQAPMIVKFFLAIEKATFTPISLNAGSSC
jgi:hypothetical protein